MATEKVGRPAGAASPHVKCLAIWHPLSFDAQSMSSLNHLLRISAGIEAGGHQAGLASIRSGSLPTGLMAFEGALWCFVDNPADPFGLQAVNNGAWRAGSAKGPCDIQFFATDAFGRLWGHSKTEIVEYDPETGDVESYAADAEGWAGRILSDWKVETGWPLMSEWQHQCGQLLYGSRLAPKIPFVLGGQFSLQNLFVQPLPDRLAFGAALAQQITDLPDGTKVRLVTE